MRVLLTLHHRLDPDAGAPGATLALGGALQDSGCEVEYFGFDEAFGAGEGEGVARQLGFPWALARFLRRRARGFDVIDASTGDAWLWASLRRPGARPRPALLTRTHGLEHVVDRGLRDSGARLSRRYHLYHGGLRLWEVRRSLALADHCLFLNAEEREYAQKRFGLAPERLSVLPNAVASHFLAAPDVSEVGGPLRLAFVGSWIARKGTDVLAAVLERLLAEQVDFTLSLLGVGEAAVLGDLPAGARERATVVPRYANHELPGLLAGHELLVFPSRSEGASVALIEAMACGLAPVATRVGANAEVIDDARDGMLVESGDVQALASVIRALGADRERLLRLRQAAQQKARGFRWERVAGETVRLYRELLRHSG